MWIHRLLSFLITCASYFFNAIGTTFLGWILDLGFLAATTLFFIRRIHREHGRDAVLTHLKEDRAKTVKIALWCSLVIYGPIAIWKVGQAMYNDHMGLAATAQRLRREKQEAIADGDTKFRELQITCSGVRGAYGALQSQNRDQQNTINNCQTQAIGLLKLPPFQPELLTWSIANMDDPNAPNRITYLLLTNIDVNPLGVKVKCDRAVSGRASFVHGLTQVTDSHNSDPNVVPVDIVRPDWTNMNPLKVEISSAHGIPRCYVSQD